MRVLEPLRQQDLDTLSVQFARRVAEQALGLGVGQHDGAGGVGDDDAVGRGLEYAAEFHVHQLGVARRFQLRHILGAGDNMRYPALGVDGGGAGRIDVNQAAILLSAQHFVVAGTARHELAINLPVRVDLVGQGNQAAQVVADSLLAAVAEDAFRAVGPAHHDIVRRGDDHPAGRIGQDELIEVCFHTVSTSTDSAPIREGRWPQKVTLGLKGGGVNAAGKWSASPGIKGDGLRTHASCVAEPGGGSAPFSLIFGIRRARHARARSPGRPPGSATRRPAGKCS